jgi:hypothetical protein
MPCLDLAGRPMLRSSPLRRPIPRRARARSCRRSSQPVRQTRSAMSSASPTKRIEPKNSAIRGEPASVVPFQPVTRDGACRGLCSGRRSNGPRGGSGATGATGDGLGPLGAQPARRQGATVTMPKHPDESVSRWKSPWTCKRGFAGSSRRPGADRIACHAEGRGFESLQPLLLEARHSQGFFGSGVTFVRVRALERTNRATGLGRGSRSWRRTASNG